MPSASWRTLPTSTNHSVSGTPHARVAQGAVELARVEHGLGLLQADQSNTDVGRSHQAGECPDAIASFYRRELRRRSRCVARSDWRPLRTHSVLSSPEVNEGSGEAEEDRSILIGDVCAC